MTIDMSKLTPAEREFVAEHERLHRALEPLHKQAAENLQRAAVGKPLQQQVGGRHYRDMTIQPVEFITKNKLGFLEGCIVKRICRHRNKNGLEDLLKAKHEIELLIALEYPEYPNSQE